MSDTKYHNQYIKEAQSLKHTNINSSKIAGWESPSNIALIKYWGKYGNQLPRNPSLSFTLKNSKTVTQIAYKKSSVKGLQMAYYFNGQRNQLFEGRIYKYLEKITDYVPFLKTLQLEINSTNTFPHSAGIASSASFFSSLALCLCNMEKDLFNTLDSIKAFYDKASFLARLGSGSASRSIPGKVALWGKTDKLPESSNEMSLSITDKVHDIFKSYHDAILIIDPGKKVLSSSEGHDLMQKHPFAEFRYNQARENLDKIIAILENGDESSFARIVENEAFTLHALLLSSTDAVRLIKPNSLQVISKLIEFRNTSGLKYTFTLDAGPNIHLLYPEKIRTSIVDFINSELVAYCQDGKWIDDKLSDGPKKKI